MSKKKLNESYDIDKILNLEKAQPEIKEAVERFNELSEEEKSNTILLYWLLGAGTPIYKMSKDDSNYTDESDIKNSKCGNCKFAYKNITNGNIICSQISGTIKLDGWCKLWKAPNIKK